MADDTFGDNQGGANVTYNPSTYKFTDPIRYFKANDPYYWEVDNIPLKQVQENILWLKDQVGMIGAGTSTGDIGRKEFTELRPFAGNGMEVSVKPGNFMGRVNDAYKTGISKLIVDAKTNYDASIFDTQKSVELSDSVLFNLVGQTTAGILNNNGLYDHLQSHAANYVGSDIPYGPGYTFDQKNLAEGIYDIPKLKLALWQQDTTTRTWAFPTATDLQQLAVEFTRAWGAPFRTALVNVENQLDIIIPEFSEGDYPIEDTSFVPSVRVDLLFIYTVPIDASATTIAKALDTTTPVTLTKPALGIVKGAGVVSLYAKSMDGQTWTGDKVDSTFLQEDKYGDARKTVGNFLQRDINESFDQFGNTQITSPIGDHNKDIGTAGVFTNFPSPDDLMNLAPYLADELHGTPSLSHIGQSVLPIAYIFVQNGATSLSNDNLLDIRPFFRTAELTYNERAGLAAANPPASLANPYVTDRDVQRRITELNDTIPVVVGNTFEIERAVFPQWYQNPLVVNNEPGHKFLVCRDKSYNQMGGRNDVEGNFTTWDVTEAIAEEHRETVTSIQLYVRAWEKDGGNTNTLQYRAAGNPYWQEIKSFYSFGTYGHANNETRLPISFVLDNPDDENDPNGKISFDTSMSPPGTDPDYKTSVKWSLSIRGYTYLEKIVIGAG